MKKKGISILNILLSAVLLTGCQMWPNSSTGGSTPGQFAGGGVSNSSTPSSSSSTPSGSSSTPSGSSSTPNSSSSTPNSSSSTPNSSSSTPSSSSSTPSSSSSTPNSSSSTPSGSSSTSGGSEELPDDLPAEEHMDKDNNGICDDCNQSVLVSVDLYSINDLHGKFLSSDSQPGVGGLTTYLKEAKASQENTILLSAGDMWQGSSESNLTRGQIINDWMSEMDFVSMTLGNHEFDWGTSYIAQNAAICDFPFLAINVYETATNQRVPYCQPSIMVETGGAKIGIIGAIGDCYSSISADKVQDVYFQTGSSLTALVKAEANRLRAAGADCIVYSWHDGKDEYDVSLSDGYVDLVFEGHTHSRYVSQDSKGVYHLQGGGENKNISHATLSVNIARNSVQTSKAETIANSVYGNKAEDSIVQTLTTKYADDIAKGYEALGYNKQYRDDTELEALVAQLYLEKGLERWGNQYNIVLGGGFLKTRSPYNLYAGQIYYSDVQSIFPFDNQIVLCSVSGAKLKSQFVQTTNSDYYCAYTSYGNSIKGSINTSATYYIVVDTYTLQYKYNGLTEVARLDETTFARDLLADYIKGGGFA